MADATGVETPVIMAFTRHRHRGTIMTYRPTAMDFWSELDGDVLRCLAERPGEMSPAELGRRLGMSEPAVCSILAMLAEAGKVRIRSVERIM